MPDRLTVTSLLHPVGRPLGTSAGWLLPGGDPAAWLAELCRWDLPLTELRLGVLPRGAGEPAAGGLFVIAPGPDLPVAGPRVQVYRRSGALLYLPLDAELVPEPAERELRAGRDWACLVWHPALGLVGFTANDLLGIHHLLAPPVRCALNWDRAQVGVVAGCRLRAVVPPAAPTVSDVLAAARGDIGSTAPEPAAAPPSTGLALGQRLEAWSRQRLAQLASAGAGTATGAGSSWRDRLRQWSEASLRALNQQLVEKRSRELRRLLDLLRTDPEAGLRYAVPFTGQGAPRGFASPGTELQTHELNFALDTPGGLPVDPWYVPPELRRELLKQYHRAATREQQLGRHRRAAYIYAHLLGDYAAAANVLAQGGHFHEAAILYRDRLHQLREAATCFEQAGLIPEAVTLYQQLGEHELAGDLYTKLAQPEQAALAYRQGVQARLTRGDRLGAAALLEHKLRDVDEALAVLGAAWPDAAQAEACLAERFRLLGDLGRHDVARSLVARVRDTPLSARAAAAAAGRIGQLATSYPDDALRSVAEDAVRVMVGRGLGSAGRDDLGRLLRTLPPATPGDELLVRDTNRYLDRHPSRPAPVPPRDDDEAAAVSLVERWHLAAAGVEQWGGALTTGDLLWACGGNSDGDVTIACSDWQGKDQRSYTWTRGAPGATAAPLLVGAEHDGFTQVLVALAANQRLSWVNLRRERPWGQGALAGTPDWLPLPIVGAACAENGRWFVLRPVAGELTLELYLGAGRHGEAVALGLALPAAWPVPLVARSDYIIMGLGNTVQVHDVGRHQSRAFPLNEPVRTLCASAPYSRLRLAVLGVRREGLLLWPLRAGFDHAPIPEVTPDALACFRYDGALVIAGRGGGRVYTTGYGRVSPRDSFLLPDEPLAAVVPGPRSNGFAAITRSGEVRLYRDDED